MAQQEWSHRSIYNGHESHPDGEFRNFVKDVHDHAKQHGHWRFGFQANILHHETRAFRVGLRNPEQLLIAYNHGARWPWHEEIILTWIPGSTDPYQVARMGTVRQHMATIAEERAVLGLPPLLAHDIPKYLISLHPALQLYREGRISGQSHVAPRRPVSNTKPGLDAPGNIHATLNFDNQKGPQGSRRDSVPQASANHNMSPCQVHPGPLAMTSIVPARAGAASSLQTHINPRAGGNVGFADPQAPNPLLFVQNQAHAPAVIGNAQTAAAHAATQQNRSTHMLEAVPGHARQSQLLQQHGELPGSSAPGATSSASNFIPDARRNPSASLFFNLNASRTPASPPLAFPNTQHTQPAEARVPVVFPHTQDTCSNETANPSRTQQHPSPSLQVAITTHIARSPHLTQHLSGAPSRLAPPQASAAPSQSSHASRLGSTLNAQHHPTNPSLHGPPRGKHSTINTVTPIATQPFPCPPRSQDHHCFSGILKISGSGAVHSETEKRQDIALPQVDKTHEAPPSHEQGPLLKSINANEISLVSPTDANAQRDFRMALSSYDSTDAQADPTLSVSGQKKAPVRLPNETSNRFAEPQMDPEPQKTMIKSDHSRQDQQKDVESGPLARISSTVPHDLASVRQGLAMLPSRSAMLTGHQGRVALEPQKDSSTSVTKGISPNLTSSISDSRPSPSVESQQHHNQPQENFTEFFSALDPRYVCAKCKRTLLEPERWTIHCSGCKDDWYCSSSCQRGAWKSHYMICKKTEQPQSTLPGIPTEVPDIGARYDPNDEFNAALMPLSENVPCMICGGKQEHQPDCMAADFQFGPAPEYNEAMLEELRRRVEYFDPEQWREHGHRDLLDPLNTTDPQPMSEVWPGLIDVVKNESSYENDAFLQAVPDQVLPLMWALRTSENVGMQLVNENGEIYDPSDLFCSEGGDDGSAEAMEGVELPP
ncbi:hypothetical protein DPSP01_006753 [Paraphaeosphaeria sporulosa]